MKNRDTKNTRLLKKGEAARLLGFGHTAGYKYIDFLKEHKLLFPVMLPGLKTPRYDRRDLEKLMEKKESADIPLFEAN